MKNKFSEPKITTNIQPRVSRLQIHPATAIQITPMSPEKNAPSQLTSSRKNSSSPTLATEIQPM